MFYSQFILAKKGPLGTIWIAAHLERKLRKNQVADTDIGVSVDSILFPEAPIALRLSSHLLLGVVRIYSRKVGYLFDDCSEALLKVKQAFRSTAVDLPPEESKAPYHSITLPETFELDDFELPDNDIFQGNYVDHHVSSREQITLQDNMEGVVYSTSKFGLDERFGDGDTSGLYLDEELFLDKVAAAGDASVSADPLASVEPMTPLKQEEHDEEMAANSESMIDGVDGDADFMDHAPCTPGLAEEPNLSNIQETSACEDHIGLEDRHLMEYAVKGNTENLSRENNVNNGSELLENQALTDGSNAGTVHFVVPENGYHLDNTCDKQLVPDGQLPPTEVAIDPVKSIDPPVASGPSFAAVHQANSKSSALQLPPTEVAIDPVKSIDPPVASGPSFAAVHQANSKSSALECAYEIIAASDSQANERNTEDKVDVSTPGGFHDEARLPNGISSAKVDHVVSALSSIGQPVPEDISPSNQRSPEAVSNNVASPGNLEAGESQDITCLETPKTVDCLEQSVFAEDANGAQVHVLSRCNAAQLDTSMSRSEHVINHEPPSTFLGFHPPETSKEEESHASGDLEQISKENPVKEPVSCEDIPKESNKSTNQTDTVVLEDRHVEIMSGSAASALPPPEKILSMPGGLVDLPRSIFPEATPDYLAGINEADASGEFISGRKRSYAESTLTEQSLYSAESLRMVRSKKTAGFIPDDDDLLSSILVGRRSSALKLKPTPPPSEITSSKRPRSAARMSASKRRNVLMDDIMVLHGDMIRQQLIHAEDIRRIRKKAPCTHAEIAAIQKKLLEDEIFREAVLTDMSVELASLHKQKFDLSMVKVSSSDVSCSHTGMAVDPQLTAVYTENSISNLDEQRAMVFNEPHVEREIGIEGSNERYVARDDSILGAVEATVPTENRDVDEHGQCLNSDASQLRPDAITDAAVPNDFNLEPSDNAAEVGPHGTCLSGSQAAEATDIASAAEELLSCHNNGGLGGDGDVVAGLPLADSFNESGKEDAFILAEVSCGPPNHTLAAQVDKALENLNDENLVDGSEWPENSCFTSEAGTGTENMIGDAVLLEAAQDSATVKDATDVENIVAENDNQSFADNVIGTDPPNRDIVYEEMDYMLDHSIGAGQYPCKEEDFSYNTVAADFSDASRGDLNQDLDYSAAGDDTGFLNFDDDDEEAEAADDYVSDADVTRITENSGWSSRTRAVSKYLQTLFIKESERGRKSLSMDGLLVGKTRKEASRMFFETLVLKTRDYIHVEQVIPFDDVAITPRMQLMKSDF
ncbi:PREDICTED: sister chromatid cohesion 1 protein 4 isoform X2 [Nicotiana attenuata]|uniref:sister chromatid cohesion 1 protein 4 isoform X2 n=1 Tax=Nicotiana attenuata TaxID=49451 RepID=UPI000904E74B|nr:PREDICTED: sister chromatid cohesion 1 protein 4 isoform X2 [Nicotiana attenuata]